MGVGPDRPVGRQFRRAAPVHGVNAPDVRRGRTRTISEGMASGRRATRCWSRSALEPSPLLFQPGRGNFLMPERRIRSAPSRAGASAAAITSLSLNEPQGGSSGDRPASSANLTDRRENGKNAPSEHPPTARDFGSPAPRQLGGCSKAWRRGATRRLARTDAGRVQAVIHQHYGVPT